MLTEREIFSILICGDKLKHSDAIVVLEGDGFSRVRKAINLFHEELADVIVLSGGIDNEPAGSFHVKKLSPLFIREGIPEKSIIIEDVSLNTRDQAIQVIRIANEKGWKRIILVASHYHQFRAYLTFLKVILGNDFKIELINAPATDLNWFEDTEWGNRYDLLQDEFEKIEEYGKMGHIASFEQAIEYQKWKEKQV
jgi:uncharacterized SAM-binding protein YcdF (DUF218 family)